MERRGTVSKRPLLLSNFLEVRGIHWLGASEPSKDGKKRLQVFRDDRSGRGNVQDRWYAGRCAHPGHVEAFSDQETCCHSDLRVFLAPTGGVRSRVILLLPQTVTARSKTGQADNTISLDSTRCPWMELVFERFERRQPQHKPLLNQNYVEYLLLFRRAAANLQVDMVPYQGRHSVASVDRAENLRTLESIKKTRAMEISQVCAPLREKRTCQPKLVRARSIGPSTLRACIATTSCPRYCFMVTPLRHRLDCFVFCDQPLSRESRCPHDLEWRRRRDPSIARLEPRGVVRWLGRTCPGILFVKTPNPYTRQQLHFGIELCLRRLHRGHIFLFVLPGREVDKHNEWVRETTNNQQPTTNNQQPTITTSPAPLRGVESSSRHQYPRSQSGTEKHSN